MKKQRIFLSAARDRDNLIKWVQEACEKPFVQEMIPLGKWDFEVYENTTTHWHCVQITCEFEIWQKLITNPHLQTLCQYLYERRQADEAQEPRTSSS